MWVLYQLHRHCSSFSYFSHLESFLCDERLEPGYFHAELRLYLRGPSGKTSALLTSGSGLKKDYWHLRLDRLSNSLKAAVTFTFTAASISLLCSDQEQLYQWHFCL